MLRAFFVEIKKVFWICVIWSRLLNWLRRGPIGFFLCFTDAIQISKKNSNNFLIETLNY